MSGRLVEIAGWNQISADWSRLIRIAPQGCLLAQWQGRPAGTATAVTLKTTPGDEHQRIIDLLDVRL